MRRSGVRIPSAPPPGHPGRPAKTLETRPGFRCVIPTPPRDVSPRCPRRGIQPVQTRPVSARAEEVQVPVRRRDGLVTHPRLHRPGIDPTTQPEARRGVPQVVDPAASTRRRPVDRAEHGRAVQLRPSLGHEEQITLGLAFRQPQHDWQHPVAKGTRRDRRPLVAFTAWPSGCERRTSRPGVGTSMTSSTAGPRDAATPWPRRRGPCRGPPR